MDPVAKILFDYLHDVIYHPMRAALEMERLPPGFRDLGEGLQYLAACISETRQFARALSSGKLDDADLPLPDNEVAAPLKTLHASLRHLTWHTQQVARGDYRQRLDFMGDFSAAFNAMVQQLAEYRRRDTDANAKLQQYVKLLLSNRQDIALLFDLDGRVVFTSESYLRCSKTDNPDLLKDKSITDVFASVLSEAALRRMRALFQTAIADKRQSHVEQEIDFGNDGALRYYLTQVVPMLDDREAAIGVLLSFHDMTEGIRSLARVQADERMRIMLDATPVCATFWDRNLTLIDCNRASAKLFDLPDTQSFLDRFFDLSPACQPNGQPSGARALELVRQTFEEGYCRFEWMHQKLDGEPVPCEVALIRAAYRDDFIVVGYIRDLRELKAMLSEMRRIEAAEASSKAKSKFLATMSHEIRTPMNVILGITAIQLQRGLLSQDAREAFSRIYSAGHTLLGIINDVLDLSKVEAGKLELAPMPYEVVSLIRDTLHPNAMHIGGKPIAFRLQVDENVPLELFGDELRIKQILNNLLSNAFKYTQEGAVTLSVAAEYGNSEDNPAVTLVCRVSDTGQGMTAEQVCALYDEYSRFNMEANRVIEGTGLGMNITQHLIRLMHGEIFVESEPGRGSTFTVRLPQRGIGAGRLGREAADNLRCFEVSASHTKMAHIVREPMPYGRVLLVDDLDTNLYVGKELLLPYGLLADTALSGFEALDKIRNGKEYDVVFMDHMMPHMDGVETTKTLRALGYVRPIVALTANAVVGQEEMLLENGFDGFIAKPVDLRQLNAALNKFVRDVQPPEVLEAARRQTGGQHDGPGAFRASADPDLADVFVRDAEKTIRALETLYTNQDYRDNGAQMFTLNVHAIKGALAYIGELELAALAHTLEQAGRERNIAVMSAETPAFLNGLRAVCEKIMPPEGDNASATTGEDQAYLLETLLVIHLACAVYDKKAAKDALAGLRQKAWPRTIKEQLRAISGHLLHSDFEEAADIAARLRTQLDITV
ncbi:MAG: response regulator [Deltaproteobacteria bacterium]|nr:response regulator [Deltaproteobacteria bacterium]